MQIFPFSTHLPTALAAGLIKAVLSLCLAHSFVAAQSVALPNTIANDQKEKVYEQPAYRWRAELALGDARLPWIFYWDGGDTAWTADGALWVPLSVKGSGDQEFTLSWPYFSTYVAFQKQGAILKGLFRDADRGANYGIPFTAERSQAALFPGSAALPSDVLPFLGRDWTVSFSDAQGQSPAAARFEYSSDGGVSGTFLTPTGDYRFLQGAVIKDTLHLAAMDGSHLFLFTASVQPDGSLSGQFRSGATYRATWTAYRDPEGYKADAEHQTWETDSQTPFRFCFPDLQGRIRCLDDPEWQGKVRIVQIMGTWCPNCLDETRFLLEQQARWGPEAFQVIALAFERGSTAEQWAKGPSRLTAALDIPWPILLAGPADKQAASKALPALNAVLAYPTTLFVDKQGKISRIHTGFNGPATGQEFANFAQTFDRTIRQLSGLETPQSGRP
ncbi:MAG: redoxin domain-containing protein [Bacteroidetes bacterium]|nr:redoxin domain-containing protein [Bacteroidota bacterium]